MLGEDLAPKVGACEGSKDCDVESCCFDGDKLGSSESTEGEGVAMVGGGDTVGGSDGDTDGP